MTLSVVPRTPLTPVLSRFWDEPQPWSLDTYRRHDGYLAMAKALAMDPAQRFPSMAEMAAALEAAHSPGLLGRLFGR